MSALNPKHRLAVLLPVRNNGEETIATEPNIAQPSVMRIRAVHVLGLLFVLSISAFATETQSGADQPSIPAAKPPQYR